MNRVVQYPNYYKMDYQKLNYMKKGQEVRKGKKEAKKKKIV